MPTEPTRAIPCPDDPGSDVRERKQALRTEIRAGREARSAERRARDDAARIGHLAAWLRERRPESVAAYISAGAEPSIMGLVDELDAQRVRVLLPVLGRREDGSPRREPDWAWYEGPGTLREGIWGIHEPSGPALGMAGLAEADVILLPGTAVDAAGHRLGHGGAWYDRALAHARPDAPLCLVLNDDEIRDAVPFEDHDRRVGYVATPAGVRELAL